MYYGLLGSHALRGVVATSPSPSDQPEAAGLVHVSLSTSLSMTADYSASVPMRGAQLVHTEVGLSGFHICFLLCDMLR